MTRNPQRSPVELSPPALYRRSMLTSLDHVVVAVNDLARATDTYRRLLGREISWRGEHPGFGTANVLFRRATPISSCSPPQARRRWRRGCDSICRIGERASLLSPSEPQMRSPVPRLCARAAWAPRLRWKARGARPSAAPSVDGAMSSWTRTRLAVCSSSPSSIFRRPSRCGRRRPRARGAPRLPGSITW